MRYYHINEHDAKIANDVNSFYEYKEGHETEAYRAAVDEVYAAADAKAEKMPEEASKAYHLADKFAREYAAWLNKGYRIESMCPSFMISGGGNFPVRKKQKQNQARDRHMADYDKIMGIEDRIRKLGTGPIKSGDENAVEKLEAKLAKLEDQHRTMKEANAYWRKHKTLEGFDGLSDEECRKIDEAMEDSIYSQPFPSYCLTNSNARIKSTRDRIERIMAEKESPSDERSATINGEECQVIENTEIMRLQLVFEGKPEAETRDILKHKGFRWSPKNGAWQRQLTDNARRDLGRIED